MWRAPLRGFFLVLVVLGVALLSLGLWARHTIYDQNQFVSVVGNLSTDPDVQAVAVQQMMSEIDRQIAQRTGGQAFAPAVSITYGMLRPQIEQGMIAALKSPEYKPYWIEALREVHGPLTDLLKGNTTPTLKQTGNQVQISLTPAYNLAVEAMGSSAQQLLSQLSIDPNNLWVTVLQGDQLASIHRYVRLFNGVLALGIIISLFSALGYVFLSSRKLRAFAWLMLAIGVGLIIQRSLLEFGKQQLVNSLTNTNQRNAAGVFYNTLVGQLRRMEFTALIIAIVAGVVIYLVDRFVVQKQLQEADSAAALDHPAV